MSWDDDDYSSGPIIHEGVSEELSGEDPNCNDMLPPEEMIKIMKLM